jgi:hypothetical protein
LKNLNKQTSVLPTQSSFAGITPLLLSERLFAAEVVNRLQVLRTLELNSDSEFWQVNIQVLRRQPFGARVLRYLNVRKRPAKDIEQFCLADPALANARKSFPLAHVVLCFSE